jgi:hypothetical protein
MEKFMSSWLKRALLVGLACVLVACCGLLTGCQSEEDAVKSAVSAEFDKVKNLDETEITTLIDSQEDFSGLEAYGITVTDVYKAMFDGFDYEITNVEVNEDTATVGVIFTVKDLNQYQSAMAEAASSSDVFENVTYSELKTKIGELLISTLNGLETKQTDEVEFICEKNSEGVWNLSSDSYKVFSDAILPAELLDE